MSFSVCWIEEFIIFCHCCHWWNLTFFNGCCLFLNCFLIWVFKDKSILRYWILHLDSWLWNCSDSSFSCIITHVFYHFWSLSIHLCFFTDYDNSVCSRTLQIFMKVYFNFYFVNGCIQQERGAICISFTIPNFVRIYLIHIPEIHHTWSLWLNSLVFLQTEGEKD